MERYTELEVRALTGAGSEKARACTDPISAVSTLPGRDALRGSRARSARVRRERPGN